MQAFFKTNKFVKYLHQHGYSCFLFSSIYQTWKWASHPRADVIHKHRKNKTKLNLLTIFVSNCCREPKFFLCTTCSMKKFYLRHQNLSFLLFHIPTRYLSLNQDIFPLDIFLVENNLFSEVKFQGRFYFKKIMSQQQNIWNIQYKTALKLKNILISSFLVECSKATIICNSENEKGDGSAMWRRISRHLQNEFNKIVFYSQQWNAWVGKYFSWTMPKRTEIFKHSQLLGVR